MEQGTHATQPLLGSPGRDRESVCMLDERRSRLLMTVVIVIFGFDSRIFNPFFSLCRTGPE